VSSGHDDYKVEPIRGLPEKLPPGERILWQGAPQWRQLAIDVFHVRAVAIYFVGLMAWRGSVHGAVAGILSVLPMALVGLGLLALLAYLSSRTTVYTITDRRLVLRIGIALPVAINLPFNVIGAAGLRVRSGGSGDIPLTLSAAERVAYSNLWPHVRPWRFKAPEPMLRSIPDAENVARILGSALRAFAAAPQPQPVIQALHDGGPSKADLPRLTRRPSRRALPGTDSGPGSLADGVLAKAIRN
jgi:hypothetical protein